MDPDREAFGTDWRGSWWSREALEEGLGLLRYSFLPKLGGLKIRIFFIEDTLNMLVGLGPTSWALGIGVATFTLASGLASSLLLGLNLMNGQYFSCKLPTIILLNFPC